MSLQGSVLLVEPDQVLAKIYNQALRQAGYKVTHVFYAQQAVEAADKKAPNVVICEIQLISHSGIEFLYEFRSYGDWRNIPVLILSSVPPLEFSRSLKGLSEDLGVTKYLYKPKTNLAELISAVDSLIDK